MAEKTCLLGQEVNRISYKWCVLTTLREKLRCKEVWVKEGRTAFAIRTRTCLKTSTLSAATYWQKGL